jgi:hypothetical protein
MDDLPPANKKVGNETPQGTSLAATANTMSVTESDKGTKEGLNGTALAGNVRDEDVEPANSSSTTKNEDDAAYPHGLKLAALSLAIFLVALDQTIISTTIPKITDHFHSVQDIGWYGSAFLLTITAL